METYVNKLHEGSTYTAAVQYNVLEKDDDPASLTIWVPMFQSSMPADQLIKELANVNILVKQISTPKGPSLRVMINSRSAVLAQMPSKFTICANVSLDERSKLAYDVTTPCEIKACSLTCLKSKNMLTTVKDLTMKTLNPTHDIIALCEFENIVTSKKVIIPTYLRSISVRNKDLNTLENITTTEFKNAITNAKIIPYSGLLLVITVTDNKGAFKYIKPQSQFIVDLGAYLEKESIYYVTTNWKHTATRFAIKPMED
uniref:Matrix protein n=2 Tax=Human respiratory syncytial virus TaxID=11250 RepID=V5N7F9_HRSV|nr:matrix protein [Human orthopneumovirus]AWO13423.1 matrix protein [Human respiratory syncytial virus A]AWO13434.1 matrix protein [Human respiratory syncytial virus A]AWO13456.1 matrix protein [Human respiratory syncytial virus A]AWO13467.1 matrix protein [Human respiratory syncytial virus A]